MSGTTTREEAALAAFWLKLYPPGAPESWHVPSAGGAPGGTAAATAVGQAAVHFDTFAFAIASMLVFPALFFPFAAPVDAVLYALLAFVLAFTARPAGTLAFLALRRRFGHPACLIMAFFLLGVCSVGTGLLPGYAWMGAPAIALLLLLRLLQGAAMAGAADGPAALLMSGAPAPRGGRDGRARRAALAQLGAPLGLMAAAGLFYLLAANLSASEFQEWGWRYPFLVAPALHLVALFARLRCLPESGVATAAGLVPARARETVRSQGRNLLIAVLAALASHALLHLATVFPLAWAALDPARQAADLLPLLAAGAVVAGLGMVASAWLAGRLGRRALLVLLACLTALASGALPVLMEAGEPGQAGYVLLACGLLGLSYGQVAPAIAASFPPRYRYTGSVLASDLAWLAGAGLAPLAALGLSAYFGLAYAGLCLLAGAVLSLAALSLDRPLELRD